MAATVARKRFNWEEAVRHDRDLQRIDALVQLTVSACSGHVPPRAEAVRSGSRYAPAPPADPVAVKAEPHPVPVTTTTTAIPSVNGSVPFAPQFIDPREYQSESSSEMDAREVNPMDDLSDFESETPLQPTALEQVQPIDVEMAETGRDEEEQAKLTVCEICRNSDREDAIILCDDCDAEFHISCLDPPLPGVPEGTWFCPACSVKHPSVYANRVKQEHPQTAADYATGTNAASYAEVAASAVSAGSRAATVTSSSGQARDGGSALANGAGGNSDPTSIPIAQALEGDPKKSNALLIHACNCDDLQCSDPELSVFCPHMKRFLRSVCWASHSDQWRSYRLARITAELFAYHAMNCNVLQCNVPLCVKIREEEIV
ncbi:unnamed protein product [Hyaloperonospora brassicae]|uniref:PHD-type domain-containing protein n=1 Tax=Hyaloperonospora brassicae TaxID=162125 RepID=A0AAV0UZ77_HYABA|nr:unnamed protein product [Hyaloperonospora brassicae]